MTPRQKARRRESQCSSHTRSESGSPRKSTLIGVTAAIAIPFMTISDQVHCRHSVSFQAKRKLIICGSWSATEDAGRHFIENQPAVPPERHRRNAGSAQDSSVVKNHCHARGSKQHPPGSPNGGASWQRKRSKSPLQEIDV